ncbi:hypothetical protein AOQ84DRAFT_60928 [Glonium stellatum]|uniref:Uncharacterized protein n=1 Tax=Glonium stellatum TaxID=574774 RepID=A0A8E2FE45_9PEZI|nr:hypothetical protein AOQ84DRAFT_60928 [Glonium stellatum]
MDQAVNPISARHLDINSTSAGNMPFKLNCCPGSSSKQFSGTSPGKAKPATHTSIGASQESRAKSHTCEGRKSRIYKRAKYQWYFQWRIGNLAVEVVTTNRRMIHSAKDSFGFTVSIQFWPSQTYFRQPGLALLYTSIPSQQGYYQPAPVLKTFPIIPEDAPIRQAICRGDLMAVRRLFAEGSASPRDQDPDGINLLAWAAVFGQVGICRYLLEEGEDPTTELWDEHSRIRVSMLMRGPIYPDE